MDLQGSFKRAAIKCWSIWSLKSSFLIFMETIRQQEREWERSERGERECVYVCVRERERESKIVKHTTNSVLNPEREKNLN